MIPSLMKEFSIGTVGVGFLSASFYYTYLILQVPAGILTDHIGPRRLLTVACAACSVTAILFALSRSLMTAGTCKIR